MLEYICELDASLKRRYETLEKNLRSASPSFYDSYLELCEEYVKLALSARVMCALGIPEDKYIIFAKRDGIEKLLRRGDILAYFAEKLDTDSGVIEKILDYKLKINSHKHGAEKHLEPDIAFAYIEALFGFTKGLALRLDIEVAEPTRAEFDTVFNSHERYAELVHRDREELARKTDYIYEKIGENAESMEELRGSVTHLTEEIVRLRSENESKASDKERLRLTAKRLEELEAELEKKQQLLEHFVDLTPEAVAERAKTSPREKADFIKNSSKHLCFFGSGKLFIIWKLLTIALLLITVAVCCQYTYLQCAATKFTLYSTYDLFVDIWGLFCLILLFRLIPVSSVTDMKLFSKRSPFTSRVDEAGLIHLKLRRKYTVFAILMLISIAADIWTTLINEDGEDAFGMVSLTNKQIYPAFITCAVIFAALAAASFLSVCFFYNRYEAALLAHRKLRNSDNNPITMYILYGNLLNPQEYGILLAEQEKQELIYRLKKSKDNS